MLLQGKMDKAADVFSQSGAPFVDFFDRTDRWLEKNDKLLIHLFTKFDEGGNGVVTWNEFKSGK